MRISAIGIGAILVVAAVIWSADLQFWSRYLTRPTAASDLTVEWYQPQVDVAGQYVALPRDLDDPSSRFVKAVTIAEEYGSDALLVAVSDTIILERYWGDVGPETPLLSFSFHKTVSAVLIGAAIADGHIDSIDDPVGNHIPQWANNPAGKRSLREVMQMSAGYPQLSRDGGPFSQAAPFSYGSDIGSATLAGTSDIKPNAQFDYSDRTAQVAGLVLQNAIPQDYEAYLSEQLWKRLKARDAAVVKADENGPAITYCCLMATAEDWLKIGMLLRDRGSFGAEQIVPPAWVDDMTTPAPSNPNFGLFLWLGSPFNPERTYTPASPASVASAQPFIADDVIFMDGAGGQRVYASRALDLVVVRLGEYRSDWDDTRLFNAIASELQAPEIVF